MERTRAISFRQQIYELFRFVTAQQDPAQNPKRIHYRPHGYGAGTPIRAILCHSSVHGRLNSLVVNFEVTINPEPASKGLAAVLPLGSQKQIRPSGTLAPDRLSQSSVDDCSMQ